MRGGLRAGSFLCLTLIGALASGQSPPPRVVLFSWDGAPYWLTSKALTEGRLPNLQRLIREGAWSDGMITSFPTKTAAAHAEFWTGHFGHTSGITGNFLLVDPPMEHDRLERESGYSSRRLQVEPLWVRTARADLMTYAFHAPQSYPFEEHGQWLDRDASRKLRLIYGYTGLSLEPDVMSEDRVSTAAAWGWTVSEAQGPEARELQFTVGDETFWALFYDDPLDPLVGCDTMGVTSDKRAPVFLARIKAGDDASFSLPIRTANQGERVWFSLRLFELAADASRFSIYRTRAQAVRVFGEDGAVPEGPALEAFAGNSGDRLYRVGRFGATLPQGGTGSAEDRFLETQAHLQRQIRNQVEPVLREGDYRFIIMYSPLTDEAAHTWVGYLDPSVPWYDEALAQRLWPKMMAAYELQDTLLGVAMDYASRDDGHVVLVSDHGMAGTNKDLNVNLALERANLLTTSSDGTVDLSRTKVLLLPLADGSIAVNTVDRRGGIVTLDKKGEILQGARDALAKLHDPETGEPIIKSFFEPATRGLLQPGGETTGDLFLDLRRGYYFSDRTDRDRVVTERRPKGDHGFVPTRWDMLAICGAWGPRIPAGVSWSRVRGVDVAPTVLDLLDLTVPSELPGRSLVPERVLIP